jgi:hypothetical protein
LCSPLAESREAWGWYNLGPSLGLAQDSFPQKINWRAVLFIPYFAHTFLERVESLFGERSSENKEFIDSSEHAIYLRG